MIKNEFIEDQWIEDLALENIELRQENEELKLALKESKKRYNDFLFNMVDSTSATDIWVSAIIKGDIKLSIK